MSTAPRLMGAAAVCLWVLKHRAAADTGCVLCANEPAKWQQHDYGRRLLDALLKMLTQEVSGDLRAAVEVFDHHRHDAQFSDVNFSGPGAVQPTRDHVANLQAAIDVLNEDERVLFGLQDRAPAAPVDADNHGAVCSPGIVAGHGPKDTADYLVNRGDQ